jgi:hypothetical protein
LYISEHVLNLDEKQQCSLRDFGGVDDLDFSFYHELMEEIHHACKITIMHKVPPR